MSRTLSITRTAVDGTTIVHHLDAVDDGHYAMTVIVGDESTARAIEADSTFDAVARTPALRRISGSDATSIEIYDSAAINSDDLLDGLRPTPSALDLDEIDNGQDLLGSWPHEIETAVQRWSTTWHRVEVNGAAVYGIRTAAGKIVLVGARSPERPFEGWTELLATSWDSSDYSGVGASGYGIDGLYLVRPGLLATVHYTDEELDVRIERVSRRATPFTLVRSRASQVLTDDRHHAQLVLAAHSPDASDVYPSDTISSCLHAGDLHRLLRRRG